jgi:mono/diheme cytochrome c family protein
VNRWCAIALLLAETSAWGESLPSGGDPAAVAMKPAQRGAIVYRFYCANCHGVDGDGKGRAARLYDPRPANLRASQVNDAYKELIIRRGGAHVGRSEFMPPWENQLTDAELHDVIAYLNVIRAP